MLKKIIFLVVLLSAVNTVFALSVTVPTEVNLGDSLVIDVDNDNSGILNEVFVYDGLGNEMARILLLTCSTTGTTCSGDQQVNYPADLTIGAYSAAVFFNSKNDWIGVNFDVVSSGAGTDTSTGTVENIGDPITFRKSSGGGGGGGTTTTTVVKEPVVEESIVRDIIGIDYTGNFFDIIGFNKEIYKEGDFWYVIVQEGETSFVNIGIFDSNFNFQSVISLPTLLDGFDINPYIIDDLYKDGDFWYAVGENNLYKMSSDFSVLLEVGSLSLMDSDGFAFEGEDLLNQHRGLWKDGDFWYVGYRDLFSGSNVITKHSVGDLANYEKVLVLEGVVDNIQDILKFGDYWYVLEGAGGEGEKGVRKYSSDFSVLKSSFELSSVISISSFLPSFFIEGDFMYILENDFDDDKIHVFDLVFSGTGVVLSFDTRLYEWCSGADINKDSFVTQADLGVVSSQFGKSGCSSGNNWCGGADINKDSFVNIVDQNKVLSGIGLGLTGCIADLAPEPVVAPIVCDPNTDINLDGVTDSVDRTAIFAAVTSLSDTKLYNNCDRADVNRDGNTNFDDFLAVFALYGITSSDSAWNPNLDVDENGVIEEADTNIITDVDHFSLVGCVAELAPVTIACSSGNNWCDRNDVDRSGSLDTADIQLVVENDDANCAF